MLEIKVDNGQWLALVNYRVTTKMGMHIRSGHSFREKCKRMPYFIIRRPELLGNVVFHLHHGNVEYALYYAFLQA